METGTQLQALHQEKESQLPTNKRLGRPHNWYKHLTEKKKKKEKKSLAPAGNRTLDHEDQSLVTVATILTHLQYCGYANCTG
jgi:hypothetical protein